MCLITKNLTTLVIFAISFTILKCGAINDEKASTASSKYETQPGVQPDPDIFAFPADVEVKSNFEHHFHHDHNFQHNPDFHRSDFKHTPEFHHSPEFHHTLEFKHSPEFHHTSEFHHTPEFHHHHHGFHEQPSYSPGVIGSSSKDQTQNKYNNKTNIFNSSSIPLELIWKVNNFTEINDLLLNLVEGDMEEKDQPVLINRYGDERSAAIVPKAANCMPELQTVKIVSSDDPSVLYIPSCTRIERCGGCCSHNLLACQPTDVETVSYQVVKTQFVGGSKLKYMGKEVILMEKHTKCKCSCKVQDKDCNSFQEYRKSECRCACTNTDEEKKCYKENTTKLWNPQICSCQCRNILPCSTGYTFDTLRCRCRPNLVRRRFVEMPDYDKTIYKPEVLPVMPLDADD